jgi:glycosyltransferase involved in cell wall biosynthesis
MRRVLMIAYDFPPIASAAAQRARWLATHLPAHGWRVTVVTPRAGTSWALDPETAASLPADVEVHRTGSIEPARVLRRSRPAVFGSGGTSSSRTLEHLREWLLVPDARVGWIPFCLHEALRRSCGPEAILTTSPPASAHVAGAIAARMARIPWVADFQDPWSLPSFQHWRGRWRPWIDGRLERAVLERADRVVATTDWLAGELEARGAGDHVRVVANGFSPDEYPTASPDEEVFTLVHTGSFYGPRNPEPLLKAVSAALRKEPEMRGVLRVRLIGAEDAGNAALLARATRRMNLEDVVERRGPVPRREALRAIRSAAVATVVTDPLEGGRGLVPLKVYEYLGAGRPILALAPPDGEAARVVRAAGGVVADTSDVSGAAAAIVQLYQGWRSGNGSRRADPSVVDAFRWDRLAGLLAEILDEAAGDGMSMRGPGVEDRASVGVGARAEEVAPR